ncbi:MAG: NAD(P)/FAD-dependent oxidoreductase [Dehalococcoidia bacterium]|nr:NAD(P)/FAD-dependent oxidoreductase [Dehalococcoidia bacterium]
MAKRDYDVIIVGAGLGGAVCGALLAKWGLKVLILDKNMRPGGKQMGISSKGFKSEMWPTYGIPKEVGPFVDAFNQLGIPSKLDLSFRDTALMFRQAKRKWATMVQPAGKQDLDATLNMFKAWQLSEKETQVAMQVLAEMAMMTPEQIDALNDVSLQQWIAQHGDMPKPLFSFLAVEANMLATGLYELVAVWEQAKIMQIFAGSTTGFPRGGYSKLVDDVVDVLKACDGELKLRARVERILVEDGRVTGVATKDGVFKAPIVVSNAGIQPTVLKLVGEKHFDSGYVNYVKGIVPSLGFCCQRYIFKEPVMQYGIILGSSEDSYIDVQRHEEMRAGKIPEVVSLYAVNPAVFDPEMAPKGKQMLLVGTWCRPDPKAREIGALQKRVDEQFIDMFPKEAKYIEAREGYVGPAQVANLSRDSVLPGLGGEAVGLAVSVGYCGKRKPDVKAPIRGLFYVGHDAGGAGYIGTHQAVSSGVKVAPVVKLYHDERTMFGK